MKKIKRWFKEIFEPDNFNGLDTASIAGAFNDPGVRALWLTYCFEEIIRINQDVDKRLLLGSEMGLTDLCARRKAFQDVLEAVLSARRKLTQDVRPNPRPLSAVNLDRVTV
jgi:hypothetical protein